jgi:hypothetical protein
MTMLKGFKRKLKQRGPSTRGGGVSRRKEAATKSKKASGEAARRQGRRDRRMLERHQQKRILKAGMRGSRKGPLGAIKQSTGAGGGSRQLLKLLQNKKQRAAVANDRLPQKRLQTPSGGAALAGKRRSREVILN